MKLLANFFGNAAYYYHSKGNLSAAEQNYVKMMKWGKPDPKLEGTYGVLLLKRGEFAKALERFNGALEGKKAKGQLRNLIRMNRAIAYFRLGDTEKAITALEDLHQNFKSIRVYQTLGYIYTAAGMFDKAEPYNLEAVEFEPDDPVILDNIGQMYLELGQHTKAKEYLERAYEEKHISDVCYHLGIVAEWEGQPEKALEYYREALTKNMDALNDVTPQMLKDRISAICQTLGLPEEAPDEDDD